MNNNTKAAVIGGVVAGVLSGIPIVGGCCFLWALAGGFLALFMYSKGAPGPIQMGDAAKLGATAGVIGAVISIVIGLPFFLLGVGASAISSSNADLPNAGFSTGLMAASGVVGLILRAVFVIAFAVLGAVIGAAILGKKGGGAGAPPPPPPPGGGYGGGTPGGGYGGTTPGGGTPGGGGYGQGM